MHWPGNKRRIRHRGVGSVAETEAVVELPGTSLQFLWAGVSDRADRGLGGKEHRGRRSPVPCRHPHRAGCRCRFSGAVATSVTGMVGRLCEAVIEVLPVFSDMMMADGL